MSQRGLRRIRPPKKEKTVKSNRAQKHLDVNINDPGESRIQLRNWFDLRTFARKFFNIDFFLKLLPL